MCRESGLYDQWIEISLNTIRIKYPNIDQSFEKHFVDFNEILLKDIFDLFLSLFFGILISIISFVFEISISILIKCILIQYFYLINNF